MSEINVTPFVDVMLVLLIVFMVTAPLLTVGIPVDLPKVKASALTDQKDPIEITLNVEGDIYIGESLVEPENLISNTFHIEIITILFFYKTIQTQ